MINTKTDLVKIDLSGETTLENMIKDPNRVAEIKALRNSGDALGYAKALKQCIRDMAAVAIVTAKQQ